MVPECASWIPEESLFQLALRYFLSSSGGCLGAGAFLSPFALSFVHEIADTVRCIAVEGRRSLRKSMWTFLRGTPSCAKSQLLWAFLHGLGQHMHVTAFPTCRTLKSQSK